MNIWWIRRDLRLRDNPTLATALEAGETVVPVFIFDDTLLEKPAEKRQAFLFAGLSSLADELTRRGSRLIIRRGNPRLEIPRLATEVNAAAVFAEEDHSPYAVRRDTEIGGSINLRLVHGVGIHHPNLVTKAGGKPYTVFTPFSKAWKTLPFSRSIIPAPASLPAVPALNSREIPEYTPVNNFPASEKEALRRLMEFLSGPVGEYRDNRNRMDLDGTSSLSPYFRFGLLSARSALIEAYHALENSTERSINAGIETWINELIWREFYQSILYHFPGVQQHAFNPAFRAIPWRNAPEDLLAWQAGMTGYPVVDAAMRQLASTGWMHNRARMITASFLVKDLLINWQEGERWFMRTLIDGDPAANNGGWQWTAGTGTDAAPYFRIFNPILQGAKFDPLGAYVRSWVPELSAVPDKWIHAPWEMPADEQRKAGVLIGSSYPAPTVDHASARARTLAAYKK